MPFSKRSISLLTFLAPAMGLASACAGDPDPSDTPSAVAKAAATAPAGTTESTAPAMTPQDFIASKETVLRLKGDAQIRATFDENRGWSCGQQNIDTPLPVGYPAPTPPGCIEAKKYPSVRRAEFAKPGTPDANGGFFPLFRHIQRNKIEMTSPVEMDYQDLTPEGRTSTWTMSFLYRTPDLHPTGVDEKDDRVQVRDTQPLIVLALGAKGSYETDAVQKHLAKLEAWLQIHPEWERAGAPRAFFYNGPSLFPSRKWLEVQLPVRAKAGAGSADSPKPADRP